MNEKGTLRVSVDFSFPLASVLLLGLSQPQLTGPQLQSNDGDHMLYTHTITHTITR